MRVGIIGILIAIACFPGLLRADALDRVTIIRDEYGVPHVRSHDLAALFRGVGYAQAQDRLWQADLFRRLATGTQAEIFGPDFLAADIQARALFGPPERREQMLSQASVEMRTVLESFSAGVNDWIAEATATGQLPVEFMGNPPREWLPEDSIAIFLAVLENFGTAGATELDHAAQLGALVATLGEVEGSNVFQSLHLIDDPSAPTTVPSIAGAAASVADTAPNCAGPMGALVPGVDGELDQVCEQVRERLERWREAREDAGLSPDPASNAIVLGPGLSVDNWAWLLGGPQMDFTTPQVNHEIGIRGAGYDATGMELPGLPGVAIGIGRGYAWTFTTGGTDNTDLVIEVLNPANPGQYFFEGEFLDFECRVEQISVLGMGTVDQVLCRSIHGPIIGAGAGVAIALQSARDGFEMQSFEANFDLMKARNLADFEAALSRTAYNFNVFYADRRGNIAFFHTGRIPIRAAGDNPLLPHDGTGGSEWQGFIPWEEMPRSINPDQGWLTSWNNKPRQGWANSTGGFWSWGPVHRVNTLIDQLEGLEPGSVDFETLAEINRVAGLTTDTPSGSARTVFVVSLIDAMLGEVDPLADSRLPGTLALLDLWDWLQNDANGDGLYDAAAVTIFNQWWEELTARLFQDEFAIATLDPNVAGNLVAKLIDPSAGTPLLHDFLDGETIGDALTASLISAIDALEFEFGSTDPAVWLSAIAMIEWVSQGAGSVPNTLWMNRGTYNQIVHLKGRGVGANVVAPGQSGDPFSPHFADQLGLYTSWQYKPMRHRRQDILANAESTTVLEFSDDEDDEEDQD